MWAHDYGQKPLGESVCGAAKAGLNPRG